MTTYIYALTDPDGAPRYVGQSRNVRRRVAQHRSDGNVAMRAWLRQLQERGLCPQVVILDSCDRTRVFDVEARWICRLSRRFVLLNGHCRGRKRSDPSLIGKRRMAPLWKEMLAA